LLSAIDRVTSQHEPSIHLYARELPTLPFLFSHMNAKTYAYIECDKAVRNVPAEPMDWETFCMLWESNQSSWSSSDCIASPMTRRGDISVWLCQTSVLVVSNTRRRTRADNRILWETVWCGTLEAGKLVPNRVPQEALESVASMYRGILFAMKEQFVAPPRGSSWRVGTSGIHAWYMYNFLPPTFGSCELQAIREEL
jgi:hypothetical protein